MRKKESFKEFFKSESDRKVFEKVFDKATIETVHYLATKKWFHLLEHVVSTGKEAHVFRAVDEAGNPRAVKIYRTKAIDFKNMLPYLEGDERFKKIRRERKNVIYAWAKKEFKNLEQASKVKAQVPLPLAFKDNVLVMSFIGEKQAAKTLKELKLASEEIPKIYKQVIDNVALMVFQAGLVHADVSEYNLLYWKGKVYFIDIGQGVLLSHPKAREFFDRDARNIARYFTKIGFPKSFEEVLKDLREKKKELSENFWSKVIMVIVFQFN